jgi:tryptophanyl-tRNA synthetase
MDQELLIELMRELLEKLNQDSNGMEIWIPAAVSIITLVLNLIFYIFVQPRITYKNTAKESLTKTSVELLNYLAEIVSNDNFDGVPTKIRKYSLQIHLQFKDGTADGTVELLLEQIFQEVQKRKKLTSEAEINTWNENFRIKVRDLRKALAKYCGAL